MKNRLTTLMLGENWKNTREVQRLLHPPTEMEKTVETGSVTVTIAVHHSMNSSRPWKQQLKVLSLPLLRECLLIYRMDRFVGSISDVPGYSADTQNIKGKRLPTMFSCCLLDKWILYYLFSEKTK